MSSSKIISIFKLGNAKFRSHPSYLTGSRCRYEACFSSNIPYQNKSFDRGERGHGRLNDTKETRGNKNPRRTEEEVADTARDTADSVAEMAKVGVVGAMETGLRLGEAAKQTLDGMWEVAKKTGENVRDSVADDGDKQSVNKNKNINYDGDSRRGKNPADKYVDDLRRRADGYDLMD